MATVKVRYKLGNSSRSGSAVVSSKTPTESEVLAALKKKHKNDVAKGKDIVVLKIG